MGPKASDWYRSPLSKKSKKSVLKNFHEDPPPCPLITWNILSMYGIPQILWNDFEILLFGYLMAKKIPKIQYNRKYSCWLKWLSPFLSLRPPLFGDFLMAKIQIYQYCNSKFKYMYLFVNFHYHNLKNFRVLYLEATSDFQKVITRNTIFSCGVVNLLHLEKSFQIRLT